MSELIPKKKVTFEALQLLRGLAAIIVVLHHIHGSNLFYFDYEFLGGICEAGWAGVDFFFVLSGFIICYIHFNDLGHAEKIANYLKKRFIRIYPTYWFFLTIPLIQYLFTNNPEGQYAYILKNIFLIQNNKALLGVSWTLTFELAFYLLFGFYIVTGKRIFYVGLFVHFLIILVRIFYKDLIENIIILDLLSSNYNIEFLFGCGIAIIIKKNDNSKIFPLRYYLIVIGVVLFLCGCYLNLVSPLFSKISNPIRFFLGISASFLILGSVLFEKIPKNIFTNYMLKIGDASYVLYLSHGIILAVVYKLTLKAVNNGVIQSNGLMVYFVSLFCFLFCVFFSIKFHYLVEKKIMKFLS